MLIKCPECGHQVSDKAPLCPNCGVEIAGNINRSAQEKNTQVDEYDNSNVQKDNDTPVDNSIIVTPIGEEEIIAKPVIDQEGENEFAEDKPGTEQKGKGHGTLVVSSLIAAIICGIGLYFYKDAIDRNNAEKIPAEEISTVSDTVETDTEVIPLEEKDTVKEAEPIVEEEQKEPEETEEEQETVTEITSAEKAKAKESVSRFLRALNSHSKEALLASATTTMTSLNGKSNASKNDILKYMIDSYQADVRSLTWSIDNVSDVTKEHSTDGIPEYKITLKATKETERDGGTSKHKFNIKATVAADGRISAINIARE